MDYVLPLLSSGSSIDLRGFRCRIARARAAVGVNQQLRAPCATRQLHSLSFQTRTDSALAISLNADAFMGRSIGLSSWPCTRERLSFFPLERREASQSHSESIRTRSAVLLDIHRRSPCVIYIQPGKVAQIRLRLDIVKPSHVNSSTTGGFPRGPPPPASDS